MRVAAAGTYLSWFLLLALVLTTFAFVIRQFVSFSFLVGQGYGTTSLDASLLGREPMHSNMHPLVDLVDEHGLLPSHKYVDAHLAMPG
jgi:hypothetical protein